MRRKRQLDFEGLFEEPDSVDEWVGTKKPKVRRRPSVSMSIVEGYINVAKLLASSGDWDAANPSKVPELMVALYIVCHEKAYGVRPIEITSLVFPVAVSMARKLLQSQFSDKMHEYGDTHAMVEFIRWVWTREIAREKWRRVNRPESDTRISWKVQFTESYLITDYRIAQARSRSNGA